VGPFCRFPDGKRNQWVFEHSSKAVVLHASSGMASGNVNDQGVMPDYSCECIPSPLSSSGKSRRPYKSVSHPLDCWEKRHFKTGGISTSGSSKPTLSHSVAKTLRYDAVRIERFSACHEIMSGGLRPARWRAPGFQRAMKNTTDIFRQHLSAQVRRVPREVRSKSCVPNFRLQPPLMFGGGGRRLILSAYAPQRGENGSSFRTGNKAS